MTVSGNTKASAFCTLYRSFREREGVMMTWSDLAVAAVKALEKGRRRRRSLMKALSGVLPAGDQNLHQLDFENRMIRKGINPPRGYRRFS